MITMATTAAMTVRDMLPPSAIIRALPRGCQSRGGSLRRRESLRHLTDLVDRVGLLFRVEIGQLEVADRLRQAVAHRVGQRYPVVREQELMRAAFAKRDSRD